MVGEVDSDDMFVQCIWDEEMVSKVADDVVLLQSVYKQLVPWLPLVEAVTGRTIR